MCTIRTALPFDRPAVKCDIRKIKEAYPFVDGRLLDAVWKDINDHHVPKPAVMVLFAELAFRRTLGEEDWGNEFGPLLPFSAMDFDQGRRFQTPTMEHTHDAMISFVLAQRNVEKVRSVFKRRGFDFVLFCDCGCGSPANAAEFMRSDLYKTTNLWRSYGEANGNPVVEIQDRHDQRLRGLEIDMTPAEFDSYDRIAECLGTLHKHEGTFPEVAKAVDYLRRRRAGVATIATV